MKQKFLVGGFLVLGTLLSACGGYGGGGYYTNIRYGPPAPRYGVVGAAPGPGYVWTDGYWDWRGGNWGWVNGRWQRPPRGRNTWVRSEWRHEGRGYRFHQGRWR